MKSSKLPWWLKLIAVIVALGLLKKSGNLIAEGIATLGTILMALVAIAIILLVAGVVIFGFKASGTKVDVIPEKKPSAKDKSSAQLAREFEGSETIKKGRSALSALRASAQSIENAEVKKNGLAVCDSIEKVLNTLKEKPEKVTSVRQMFNYYLPTLDEIFKKYKSVEKGGVNMGDTAEKVNKYLKDITAAMEKQNESLYSDDFLDLTVEMEAMTMAVKRDGLIEEDPIAGENSQVNLSL